eukprot:316964-Heterocapsa_arctica.AAC.1
MWALDEPIRRRRFGDEVTLPAGVFNVGGRALVSLDGLTVAIRFLGPGEDIDRYSALPSQTANVTPCRTLPSRG